MNALFPTLVTIPIWVMIGIVALALLCLVVTMLSGDTSSKTKRVIFTTFYSIILGLCVLVMVWVGAVEIINHEPREKAKEARALVVEENGYTFEEAYGNISGLKFPEEKPTQDTEYGTTWAVKGKEHVRIQLVWENDEFVLVEVEGKKMKPLK